jgi:hypothetical protein
MTKQTKRARLLGQIERRITLMYDPNYGGASVASMAWP